MKRLFFAISACMACIIGLCSFVKTQSRSNIFWFAAQNHGHGLGYIVYSLVDEPLAYNQKALSSQPSVGNQEYECQVNNNYVCAALFSTFGGIPYSFQGVYMTGEYNY